MKKKHFCDCAWCDGISLEELTWCLTIAEATGSRWWAMRGWKAEAILRIRSLPLLQASRRDRERTGSLKRGRCKREQGTKQEGSERGEAIGKLGFKISVLAMRGPAYLS